MKKILEFYIRSARMHENELVVEKDGDYLVYKSDYKEKRDDISEWPKKLFDVGSLVLKLNFIRSVLKKIDFRSSENALKYEWLERSDGKYLWLEIHSSRPPLVVRLIMNKEAIKKGTSAEVLEELIQEVEEAKRYAEAIL